MISPHSQAPIHSLTVLIPCLNEAPGIPAVVAEFRAEFPHARLLVVDNGSTDGTADAARGAGAEVLLERRRGKAMAIQTGLADISTDLVLMVDGDGSYPAKGGRVLYEEYCARPADMLTGVRCSSAETHHVFRPMHQLGMSVFSFALGAAFGHRPADLFSGLRLFSARFYQNVPVLSSGFELEIELTLQAIDKGFSFADVLVPFRQRAEGTASKLRTFRDGWRILRFLFLLFRDYKPLAFFGGLGSATFALGLLAGSLPVWEYFTTGFVGRFPLAILAAALVNVAAVIFLVGTLLQSSLRYHREAYQVELRRSAQAQRRDRSSALAAMPAARHA